MERFIYLFLLISTFAMTVILLKTIIPRLKKTARQPIYESGPSWHMKKEGTPTMGGIGFIIPICISAFVSSAITGLKKDYNTAISLIISITFCITNALVGVTDDITKLKRASNGGLTPKQKLALQFIIASAFLVSRKILFDDNPGIYFADNYINLGMLYYPLAIIFILGMVNCANLTDGVDGLASSVAFSIAANRPV